MLEPSRINRSVLVLKPKSRLNCFSLQGCVLGFLKEKTPTKTPEWFCNPCSEIYAIPGSVWFGRYRVYKVTTDQTGVGLDSCVLRGGGKIVSVNFFLWCSSHCPLEIETFITVVYVGCLGVSA